MGTEQAGARYGETYAVIWLSRLIWLMAFLFLLCSITKVSIFKRDIDCVIYCKELSTCQKKTVGPSVVEAQAPLMCGILTANSWVITLNQDWTPAFECVTASPLKANNKIIGTAWSFERYLKPPMLMYPLKVVWQWIKASMVCKRAEQCSKYVKESDIRTGCASEVRL